jgi:hypothetical protein
MAAKLEFWLRNARPFCSPDGQAEGRQGKDSHEASIQQPPVKQVPEPPAKAQEPAASTTTASVPAPAPAPSPEAAGAQLASQEGTPPPKQAPTNRNTAKAEAKLQKALDYLFQINEQTDNRDEKWVITEGLLFSLTGSFNSAIRRFFAARQEQIQDHNRKVSVSPTALRVVG